MANQVKMLYVSKVLLVLQIIMIKAPLTFHNPQTIFNFLQKQVGPHKMLIKKGWALITFDKEEHNTLALQKYKTSILQGHPLRLTQFRGEEDLDYKPEPMCIQPQEAAPSQIAPTQMIVQAPISDTAKMVEQAIEIKDQNDRLQVVTKTHFKEVIECLSKFKPIYTTAKNKEKALMSEQPSEGEKTVKELYKFTEYQLNDLKNNVMGLYKKSRSYISKFGQKQKRQIDLDPSLQHIETENNPINAGKLQPRLHYINKQPILQLKRLAVLNKDQFICTNLIPEKNRKKGKVKVYSQQEEYELMSTILSQGAYGLSMVDKYLLVGNQEGSISFWNSNQGSIGVDQPFQMTPKLHDNCISDILKYANRDNGFTIATLGFDSQVKIFNVTQDLITQDMSTLFFQQMGSFHEERNKQIFGIDIYSQKKIVGCSWNRIIMFDMDSLLKPIDIQLKTNISKVKTMSQNVISLYNQNNITFLDPRDIKTYISCPITEQGKSLCKINDFTVCYGGDKGELGLVDSRNTKFPLWKDNGTHHSKIYDILKIGNNIVSGDQKGLLVSWNSIQSK